MRLDTVELQTYNKLIHQTEYSGTPNLQQTHETEYSGTPNLSVTEAPNNIESSLVSEEETCFFET